MSDAKQTPLHERLESVPAALRCIVDHSPLSSSSYPIGALCQEAAAALRAQGPNLLLEWAVSRWRDEVEHRPLANKNRRPLDDAWRQVIRWAGGDDGALIGPTHDELLASAPQASQPPQGSADPTDPGSDVGVLREHVRHLERHIRQLHALAAPPQGAADFDTWYARQCASPMVVRNIREGMQLAWAGAIDALAATTQGERHE